MLTFSPPSINDLNFICSALLKSHTVAVWLVDKDLQRKCVMQICFFFPAWQQKKYPNIQLQLILKSTRISGFFAPNSVKKHNLSGVLRHPESQKASFLNLKHRRGQRSHYNLIKCHWSASKSADRQFKVLRCWTALPASSYWYCSSFNDWH